MELPQLPLNLVNPFSFGKISAKVFLCLGIKTGVHLYNSFGEQYTSKANRITRCQAKLVFEYEICLFCQCNRPHLRGGVHKRRIVKLFA